MEKKFVIYWDETFMYPNITKVVDLGFFSSFNNFDIEEKNNIERLEVGDTTPMDNHHVWVMRVK